MNPTFEGEILRVGGRLANSQLPHENKHPLLLHPDNVFSCLLVEHAHQVTAHGGIQLTLAIVRLQYWMVKGRTMVKAAVNRCFTCRLYSKKG